MDSFFNRIRFQQDHLMLVSHRTTFKPMKGYYHYHAAFEMLFVHQGCGKVVVNQRTYEIQPGMLFVFQPFQLHIVHPEPTNEEPYERTIVHFDAVGTDACASGFPEVQAFYHYLWRSQLEEQCFDLRARWPFVKQLCERLAASQPQDRDGRALLLLQLIACVRELYRDRMISTPGLKPRTHRYSEQVMQWIEEHYMEEFELERLADDLHLSKNYVSRRFRQETGTTIMEYLMARRMKEACKLLQTTDWPVERIGAEVGLANASYFCQLFKRLVGITPLKYRKTYERLGESWRL